MSLDLSQSAAFQKVRTRERERFEKQEAESKRQFPVMSRAAIVQCCVANDGYELPELNDKLYLHFKGFGRIENLDGFTACTTLFLESNGLTKIENLEPVAPSLRCLYLQQNLIDKVEGLTSLKRLLTLDLSQNRLTKLEGLDGLDSLNTLNVSKNALVSVESIAHLAECTALTNVDVSANKLADPAILDVFSRCDNIVALKLEGNPASSNTKNFRKTALNALPGVRYLDRPVEERERAIAVAWAKGGKEAEMAARAAWSDREKQTASQRMETYRKWSAEMAAKRQAEMEQERAANPDGPEPVIWRSHISRERRAEIDAGLDRDQMRSARKRGPETDDADAEEGNYDAENDAERENAGEDEAKGEAKDGAKGEAKGEAKGAEGERASGVSTSAVCVSYWVNLLQV